MKDIDALPIPDWGLRCPRCDDPLAGLQECCCAQCQTSFDILDVLAVHRPIPDIDLRCPECKYLLTGLTGNRCPECGSIFYVRRLIDEQSPSAVAPMATLGDPPDHHVKKREPTFSGDERPLPEFGLACQECAHSLTGTTEGNCPSCGAPFDLSALTPRGDWVNISRLIPRQVASIVKAVLYDARIPYLVDNAALSSLYGGTIPLVSGRIRIPRPFFFDALHCLGAASHAAESVVEAEWICPACSKHGPAGFEICWNCGQDHPDHSPDHSA